MDEIIRDAMGVNKDYFLRWLAVMAKQFIAALIPAIAIVLLMYTVAGKSTTPKYTVLNYDQSCNAGVYMVEEYE